MQSSVAVSAECRASLICSYCSLGYFVETKTALKVPTGIVVGDYRLESVVPDKWILCCCDHGLGSNKSQLVPKHKLSPRV